LPSPIRKTARFPDLLNPGRSTWSCDGTRAKALSLLLTCLVATATAQTKPTTLSLGKQRPNELALWDLGPDGKYELFTTSLQGQVAAYDATTLEMYWSLDQNGEVLTAPVIGNFLGNGAPVLAWGSNLGSVTFAWPGTGQIIGHIKVSQNFSVPPSVVEMPSEKRALLVLPADSGEIVLAELTPDGEARSRAIIPNTVPGSTAYSNIGQFDLPVACDDLDRDGTPELIATSASGAIEVVSLTDPPTRTVAHLAQNTKASVPPIAGPMDSEPSDVIVIGVEANVHMFRWKGGPEGGKITPLLETPAFGTLNRELLLAPVNADASLDLVGTSDNIISARYLGRGPGGEALLFDIPAQALATLSPPFQVPLPYIKQDNSSSLLTQDARGDLLSWQPAAPNAPSAVVTNSPVRPGSDIATGCFVRDGTLQRVGWDSSKSELFSEALPVEVSASSPPVLTLGVNYARNGQWGPAWSQSLSASLQAAKEALTAVKAGSTTAPQQSPLSRASMIAGISPDDPMAQAIQKDGKANHRFLTVASIVLSLVVLLSLGALFFFLKKRQKH
jgi:hypothetical protein